MTWDEMMIELRKEYPDVIGEAERIAEQLDGHISKLDAYEVLSDYYHHRTEAQHEALREALSRVPAADVVPVVRCKDCKWWKLSDYNTMGIHICQRFSGVRGEHDFCSRGETDNG